MAALHRYGLVGRDLDPVLEDLVRLATLICALPMGAINLIDVDLQRQAVTFGTPRADAPRLESYCDVTVSEDRPVVVADTRLDPRFANRAFTTGELGDLRTYAGAQLTTPEGHHLGALCVFDVEPGLVSATQVDALELLARQVMAIFEAHRRADALLEAEQRFRLAFTHTPIGMALLGLDGRFLQVNPALALLVGRDEDEMVGAHIADLTHPEDRGAEAQLVSELVAGTRSRYRLEKRYVHRDGRVVWVEAWGSLVRDAAGGPAYVVKQVEDIDDRRHLESGLVHQATHDALTGLPNRALLADRLDQALAAQSRGGQLVVCSIDLDGFKAVNDTYGHAAGDALLVEVAERLRAEVRRHDTVCRLGGDEFVIVSHEPTIEEQHVPSLVERITRAVSQPFRMGVHELVVGMTLGVAVTQRTDQAPEWLLRCSDEAMYRAKHRCRGSAEVVDVDALRDL